MRYTDPDGRIPLDTFVDIGYTIWDTGNFLGASAAAGVGWATGDDALMNAGLAGMGETGTNLGIDAAAAVVPYLAAPVARTVVKHADDVADAAKNVSKYIRAPEKIKGIPGLKRAKSKTGVQGGGGLRRRWKDSKGNIYEWDRRHGALEKYNRRGKHQGEYDPTTGRRIKPPIKRRKVEP